MEEAKAKKWAVCNAGRFCCEIGVFGAKKPPSKHCVSMGEFSLFCCVLLVF